VQLVVERRAQHLTNLVAYAGGLNDGSRRQANCCRTGNSQSRFVALWTDVVERILTG